MHGSQVVKSLFQFFSTNFLTLAYYFWPSFFRHGHSVSTDYPSPQPVAGRLEKKLKTAWWVVIPIWHVGIRTQLFWSTNHQLLLLAPPKKTASTWWTKGWAEEEIPTIYLHFLPVGSSMNRVLLPILTCVLLSLIPPQPRSPTCQVISYLLAS